MILTCPECQTQYKLDPAALGTGGREVRCVGCRHTWFQLPENTILATEKVAADFAPPKPSPAAESLTAALDSILEQDDAAFEAILSGVGSAPKTAAPVPQPSPVLEARETIRRPALRQESDLTVVTHNPFGVGASAFGGGVFAVCLFLTLAAVFIGKKQILHSWPQTALLYKTIGFDIKAPGEGLRIGGLAAEHRIDSQDKVLVVEGTMTNMTEHDLVYPALHVMVKNNRDSLMKTWDVRANAEKIASGKAVPLKLQLSDAPEDGSVLEVRVKDE